MSSNALMKEAIKKGNKNISLTTIGLRRKTRRPNDGGSNGGTSMQVRGAEGQTGPAGLAQAVALSPKRELADITIYHIEKNVAIDSNINRALRQTNELIRIANLSYYHQSKSEFVLCNKELRLLKACGIQLPRSSLDSKAYFKTREFQLLLKDRALKLLVVQLQRAQDLPVSNTGAEGLTFEVSSPSTLSPALVIRPGLSPSKGTTNSRTASQLSVENNKLPKKLHSVPEKSPEIEKVDKKERVEMTQVVIEPQSGFQGTYARVYVGNGNNFPLVRSVLKYRWWFQMAEKPTFEKCHLIWTSWWR